MVKQQVLAALAMVRDDLLSIYVERDSLVDVVLRSILSRSHVCLIGAPGIAKTAIVDEFVSRVSGATLFKRLTRRDSSPEEFLGPVSLKGLENDDFRRVLDPKAGGSWGKRSPNIVRAHVAVIDEAFKANSNVLNSNLDVLNERRIQNGDTEEKCALISAFLLSNEMPQSDDLAAFWDRCLARVIVKDIQEDGNFLELMNRVTGNSKAVDAKTTVDLSDLEAAIADVETVKIPVDVNQQITNLRRDMKAAGLFPSSRRWVYALGYLKAAAWLDGRDTVDNDDLLVLSDCLWEKEDDMPEINRILSSVASPDLGKIVELSDAAKKVWDDLNKSGSKPDASALLECNAKLRSALKEIEKIQKATASSKAKNRATKAIDMLKNCRKGMLEALGMGGDI